MRVIGHDDTGSVLHAGQDVVVPELAAHPEVDAFCSAEHGAAGTCADGYFAYRLASTRGASNAQVVDAEVTLQSAGDFVQT